MVLEVRILVQRFLPNYKSHCYLNGKDIISFNIVKVMIDSTLNITLDEEYID